jgi:hypothetical protein
VSAIPQIAAVNPEALAAAIAQALGHGRERHSNGTWRTFCPAHNDGGGGHPSLDVTAKSGKVLLYSSQTTMVRRHILPRPRSSPSEAVNVAELIPLC